MSFSDFEGEVKNNFFNRRNNIFINSLSNGRWHFFTCKGRIEVTSTCAL